jgi:hypothetical protein
LTFRLSEIEKDLGHICIETKCAKEQRNLHIKLLESNIVNLKAELSSIFQEKSQIEEQKKKIEALEKENQVLSLQHFIYFKTYDWA